MDADSLLSHINSERSYYMAMVFQIKEDIDDIKNRIAMLSEDLRKVNRDKQRAEEIIDWLKGRANE
ncbi:hypothetical protein [Thermoplasma sp.]|uniref:hypothetical protein n=1 Tax=Thermoplasma sp. TaxID=1973142 RepID=UPI001285BA3A|nr:hypothetical protein [Thermoplasma sp.]KAA8921999.1 MAG: hypothetical protein F6Q11_06655 [Thermoplasma sp.]